MEKKSLSGKRLLLGAETVRTGIRDTDENFFFSFRFPALSSLSGKNKKTRGSRRVQLDRSYGFV